MKNLMITTMIVFVLSGTTSGQDELKVSAQADFFNKYIWRGQNLTDGPVHQPSVALARKRWTLSLWGNQELTNANNNKWNMTETNISLDHTNNVPGQEVMEYSYGFIHYDFPNTSFDDTTELYAGVNWSTWFNPYVKLYRDIDEVEGTYVSIGISEELWCGWIGAASLGWGDRGYNKSYWSKNSSRLNDFVLSFSRPLQIGGVDVFPSISYVRLVDKDLGSIGNAGRDDIVLGVSLRWEFK